jgi:5-methyltetrahydropteroyltriglutamate--homocysteine methyltransferase
MVFFQQPVSVHADVVGSLLRPAELLAAQKQLAAGTLSTAQFKEIEDRAVDEAIALQENAGLEIVTDGEMRRQSFQSQMTGAVDGFGAFGLDAFLGATGTTHWVCIVTRGQISWVWSKS